MLFSWSIIKGGNKFKTFKEDIASSIPSIFEDLRNFLLKKCNKKSYQKFSICSWLNALNH